jgi:hypothetical protein
MGRLSRHETVPEVPSVATDGKEAEMEKLMKLGYGKGVSLLLFLAMVLSTPLLAHAQAGAWTTVGSAGTVDEADTSISSMSGGQLLVSGAAALPANLDIRYNVVAVDGLYEDCIKMAVRFKDNGANSRVIVRLKQYGLETGTTTTMLTLDSNTFGSDALYQLQSVATCNKSFNFGENAYFIEATLKKTGAKGAPGLAVIKIYTNPL